VLGQGDDIVPIPGTKKRKFLEENIGVVGVNLTRSEADALDRALPPGAAAGFRYPEFQLKGLGL
jgi:aryl-alcohol dehydrogenase-like predicted oxidoreductase